MILDTIHGIIDRRVLLNYRIDPDVLGRVLPRPFQPKLFDGHGIGGVCMIRFKQLRPKGIPSFLGLGSENAAHRIAVQWNQDGEHREGVYIPRRDTNSWFNKSLGGRLFPGIFERSRFETEESVTGVSVRIIRQDGGEEIAFSGRETDEFPEDSIFPSLDEAANFFSLGATGYSSTRSENHYHGMELHSLDWSVSPLSIESARSCFFNDANSFPNGSIKLDCALLMREIKHEWHSRSDLYSSPGSCRLSTNRSGQRSPMNQRPQSTGDPRG